MLSLMINKLQTITDPETGDEYYKFATNGFVFVWHGGPYVDIFPADLPDNAFDCINVWDYEKNEPTITIKGLIAVAQDWLNDSLPDWRNSGALADHVAYYSTFSENN